MRTAPNPTPPNPPRLESEPPDGRLPPAEDEGRVHDLSATGQRLDGADARLLEWRGVVLRDCGLQNAQLPKWDAADVRFARCDLAGIDVLGGSLERIELDGCRLTGAALPETRLTDVRVRDCRADLLSLRYATLERVVFESCALQQLDLRGARLSDVAFVDCELVRLDVTDAHMRRTRFTGGQLEQISGLPGLHGATLGHAEAIGLAHELAAALGIKIAAE